MSPTAAEFIAANKRSRVVSGHAVAGGGQGAHYVLANGRSFDLTVEDCAAVAPIRWKGPSQ